MRYILKTVVLFVCFFVITPLVSQDDHHYQTDFTIENFKQRRTKVLDAIGSNAIALIQGNSGRAGFSS